MSIFVLCYSIDAIDVTPSTFTMVLKKVCGRVRASPGGDAHASDAWMLLLLLRVHTT